MRILHTSDWHLGRTLHKVSLAEAQEAHRALASGDVSGKILLTVHQ